MLLNNALFSNATVWVVSRDAVFARMLELELREAGLNAVRGEEMPTEAAEADKMRVFTVSSEIVTENPELQTDIEFGYSETGSGRAGRYFKRPFAVEALIQAVIELLYASSDENAISVAVEAVTVASKAQESTADSSPAAAGLVLEDSGEFSYNGESLTFTETEKALLTVLYENRGNAVSREELLERVWGRSEGAKTNLTDVYIRYLREKLDDRFDVRLILSVRGKGYMLR